MSTTFGDLTAVARRHLHAVEHLDHSRLDDAESTEVLAALAHCLGACQLLWRTVDRADRRFSDPDPAWQRAGQQLDRGLTAATGLLGRAGSRPVRSNTTAAATRLDAAAVAIGASHDLLATHTGHPPSGPVDRTGIAAVIDSPDGRRAIASATASHLHQLAALADAVGRSPLASRATREAALRAGEVLHGALRSVRTADALVRPVPGLLPAVPLVEPLRLAPLRDGEPPDVLLREAIRGAERLHRVALEEINSGHIVRHTPGSMAAVTVAMTTGHLATAQALRQLRTGATALLTRPLGEKLAAQLEAATGEAERAGHAWVDVRTSWRGLRAAREHGPADVVRREAGDLTTRLGRLVHTDPTWRPTLDADKQLRPGRELAPDPSALFALLGGLRQFSALAADIAADHVALTRALYSQDLLLVRTRTLSAEHDTPRTWSVAPSRTVQRLLFTQHHATATSRRAWSMNLTLTEMTPHHHQPASITLEMRRMAVSGRRTPANTGRTW